MDVIEEKAEALRLRTNGLSYKRIAEILGRGTMTVWQWLNPDHISSYDRLARRAKERRIAGLCVICGKHTDSASRCQLHLQQHREHARKVLIANRQLVFDHYGESCYDCGETSKEFLAIDHVHGGGKAHRGKMSGTSAGLVRWLIKNDFPSGFEVCCHNCNFIRWYGDRKPRPIKLAIFGHYGMQCACCNESRLCALTIDHINGHGIQHRKDLGCTGGTDFYYWLKTSGFPTGYQTLCFNCNSAKGSGDHCPHQRVCVR